MSEAEWLACVDPQAMLAFLREKTTERKLRLFSVACCRHVWNMFDKIGRDAVELSERYADGLATSGELIQMENLAWWGADGLNYEENRIWYAGWAAHAAVDGNTVETALLALKATETESNPTWQCELLREIIGNPFRIAVTDPGWLTWHAGMIVKLAEAVYVNRAFDRLPVLTDALEEAGCTDAGILAHCRGSGPHVRGCWLVDLLLGKN